MDLSIIIVNWNGGELLLRCLRSIRASRTSFAVKVIVVDNDSHDGSRERAEREFPEFGIFNSGANLGFGRANNLARPRVNTPLVLFLNPDTELKPDTLEKVVELMKTRPEIGAAGCMMRYVDGTVQEQGLQWQPTPLTIFLEFFVANSYCRRLLGAWLPKFDPLKSGYVSKLYGGFLIVQRDLLDKAGWFDERYFMYVEDVDLCRTLRALGSRLYYSSETEILHVGGGTSAKAPSGFSVLVKHDSLSKYMRKYYGRVGQVCFRAVTVVGATVRIAAAAVVFSLACLFGKRAQPWADSVRKQQLMLLWGLGLKQPPAVARVSRAPQASFGSAFASQPALPSDQL